MAKASGLKMKEGEELSKVPFFHVRFPSVINQTIDSAPGVRIYSLNDNVYAESNSSIFGINDKGYLEIKKPGTYVIHLDVRIDNVDGDWVGSGMQVFFDIESIDSGITKREVELMCELISEEVIDFRKARFYSTNTIHVGDGSYGIDGYGAKMIMRMDTSGDYNYSAGMNIMVTKIS